MTRLIRAQPDPVTLRATITDHLRMTKTPTRDPGRHTVSLAARREMRAPAEKDEAVGARRRRAAATVVFVVEPATEGRL